MKRKIIILFMIMCLGIMPMPTMVTAGTSVSIDGTNIHANGNAIILAAGTTTDYTAVYLDANSDGAIDGGDSIQTITGATGSSDVSGYNLSSYNIFGGGKSDLTGNTKITMLGGKVSKIYGGGNYCKVIGNTDISISDGVVDNLYGGSTNGDLVGNTNITVADGKMFNIYAGSQDGDVTGSTNITIDDGSFTSILGGTNLSGDATTSSSNITINGGKFYSFITGGGNSGSEYITVNGDTNITITGGTFLNFIAGGAYMGIIKGNTNIDISGGTFNGGTFAGKILGDCSNTGYVTGFKNIIIRGGTISDIPSGHYTNLTNGTNPVYKTKLTLPGISSVTDVNSSSLSLDGAAASYGLTDVKTTDTGLLTFYLPTGNATASYGSSNYAATVTAVNTNTFVASSSDAGLTTVATLTDQTAQGFGTVGSPIDWKLNVANAKSNLARADIEVAANATFNLYSNADFTAGEITGESTMPLTVGYNFAYIKVTAQDGTTIKYYKVRINRAPTYTMTAIANQNLTAVTTGYGAGTQQTKTLTLERTGTGDLANITTALSGANAGSFTISQPISTTLNDGTPNTSFTVKANDGLTVGTYTATITVSATNMTNETFTVTQEVKVVPSVGGGSISAPPPVKPILRDIKTQDEQRLEDSLQNNGQARIELASTGNGQVTITNNILGQLAQLNKPLKIVGQGFDLLFDEDSLTNFQDVGEENENQTMEIGGVAVTTEEQKAILSAAPLGENTGVFQVGGQIFNFTAQLSSSKEKITSFVKPVAITIDLSGLTLTPEQIGQLTGTRLEKNELGEIVPVFLGGTYDSVNKTFTFYTDKFSYYTVLQKNKILILNLTIGNTITKLNGVDKAIDVPPYLINNRTFVPLRFIGEALGASFDWNGATKTVAFKNGVEKLNLIVGKTIPGMDVAPTIINGRTMVPLRYISEKFGAQVMWFPANKSVSVIK